MEIYIIHVFSLSLASTSRSIRIAARHRRRFQVWHRAVLLDMAYWRVFLSWGQAGDTRRITISCVNFLFLVFLLAAHISSTRIQAPSSGVILAPKWLVIIWLVTRFLPSGFHPVSSRYRKINASARASRIARDGIMYKSISHWKQKHFLSMPIVNEREKEKNSCSVCGMALYNHEIGAAIIDADLVDFSSYSWGGIDLVLCRGCWSKINGNINEPYDKALKRRREIDPTFTPEKKKNNEWLVFSLLYISLFP